MLTTDQVAVSSPDTARGGGAARRPRRLAAAVLGSLAALLALAVPFLPVQQDTAELRWPTAAHGTDPVTAPLVALRPVRIGAQVGCAAIRDLEARTLFPATVLATAPPTAPDGALVGMQVTVEDATLVVTNRGQELARTPVPPGECQLDIVSDAAATTVTIGGATLVAATGDQRPQVVGVYSDLDEGIDDVTGTAVRIRVDNRFDSTPGPLKTAAGALAVLALLGGLLALRRIDGPPATRLRLRRARVGERARDVTVIGVLGVWTVIGSQTADDGYILTMVRAADAAGYVGNYYRWFDVPEAPFGWFYELYAVWAHASDAMLWLRLPALAMGIACWLLISRGMLPRLGRGVRVRRSAAWAAAAVFLCFWLPYNNGLRPEPVVVLCALLALCAVERALASRRLTPLVLGLVAAAFAVAATPTGLIATAPFLAAGPPILRLLRERATVEGWPAVLGPIAGSGLVVLVAVFGDQTLATVAEATRVRTDVGPNLSWFSELYRYNLLFAQGQDGAVARRFAVLVLLLATAVATLVLLRRGRIPGAAAGPTRRLITVTLLGFAVLALTPTKWTHHFGAFAALGAGIAAVAVVAASATGIRSRRNRLLFLAGVTGVTALAFTGNNTWWYASNWGIPWYDEPPGVNGVTVSAVFLALTAALLALAAVEHLSGPTRPGTLALRTGGGALAVLCGLLVLFQLGSLTLAVRAQGATGYTVATDILRDPAGEGCGLSARVMVETEPSAGALPATDGPGAAHNDGFVPGGLPPTGPGSRRDTDGEGNVDPTVQLSVPGAAPVLGSWRPEEPDATGELRTSWFALPAPERRAVAPLVVAAAGPLGDGNELALEFAAGERLLRRVDLARVPAVTATADPSGSAAEGRGWRDLRVDLTALPAEVDRVRLVAEDRNLSPEGWLAITPPRVPRLTPLTTLVGDAPGFLDWPVAFPHPCLRPFDITNGVAEPPAYRILADPQQRANGDTWSAPPAGGPQAWINELARQRVVPTYLEREWGRDWGQLRLLQPYVPQATGPDVVVAQRTVWGLEDPGPIGPPPAGRPVDAR